MNRFAKFLLTLAFAAAASGAAAQPYPSKPLRFVVPVAAGGLTDILTRLLATRLQDRLGQSVVVDNKTGAGGIIGMESAAKSPADGYTILMSYIGVAAVNPSLYKDLPYDTLRDFAPVGLVASFPMVLAVHPDVPAKTTKEFIELAKSRPGTLNYGSAGNATTAHLAMELFRREAGIDLVHIPYKGAAPALNELMGGRIAAVFDSLTLIMPQAKAGRVRALGIASRERSKLAPEIPTISEGGVKDFEVTGWYGVLAPAGTPRAIVERLEAEFLAIVKEPAMREQMLQRGIEPIGEGASRFGQLLRSEIDKWRRVVQESKLRPD